jgi:RHS repeat-associated protein
VLSTATQGWTYDSLGLVKTHSHPRSSGAFAVTHNRACGYVTGITAAGQTVVSQASYGPSGALSSWTAGNGVQTSVDPDPALLPRPSRIRTSGAVATPSGGNFDSGTFRYDGAGNIVAMGTDAFEYDPRSRLTTASYPGIGSQRFSYDRYGNLLSDGATTFCAGTCVNNRLSAPYSYDARGNLKANGTAETLTYDELSRQVREQRPGGIDWRYLYDGSGERAAKVPAGGTTQYTYRDEGNRVATEYYGATLGRDNVFLGNLLVASYVSSTLAGAPGWHWYHSDHLGTPRLVTDSTRAVVESRKYWPYGDGVPGQAGTLQKIRFCAMERDSENSHYYDHARMHDAVVGRFLNADSVGGSLDSPQSWNRYNYGLANPQRYVDPDGNLVADAFDHVAYQISRQAWESAAHTFLEDPSWTTGLTAAARFVENAFDSAALLLPAVPAVFGHARVFTSVSGDLRNPGKAVIGHYPEYVDVAKKLGARFFNVPPRAFARMTESERWAANQKFLDRLIMRGDEVVLATALEKVRPGSYLAKEIRYLLSHGYQLAQDGKKLVKRASQ